MQMNYKYKNKNAVQKAHLKLQFKTKSYFQYEKMSQIQYHPLRLPRGVK